MRSDGLVIAGGSYSAFYVATQARSRGYKGPIRIIGEERQAPYQRPALSKGFLTDDVGADDLALRAPEFYMESDIALTLGVRVVRIDRIDRAVHTDAGERVPYDYLAIATGARPRKLTLPGSEAGGILYLRSLEDAQAIKQAASKARHVVIVGGGFIGLEVASTLARSDAQVTLIEAQDRLLKRAGSPELARFLQTIHESRGVKFAFDSTLEALQSQEGRISGVTVDGETAPCDLLVVGIGVKANDELARDCGLICGDGIVVDEMGWTSDPYIFACGDCALFPAGIETELTRAESIQHAIDHGKLAGATIAGRREAYVPNPWFWSDQYEMKVQTAGTYQSGAEAVFRTYRANEKFSIGYFHGGRLIAVDSINSPADHLASRRIIGNQGAITPERFGNSEIPLGK